MSSTSQRFSRLGGMFLALAAAGLAGCATTGGGAHSATVQPQGTSYMVCSGSHASRFPEREEIGRVCRTSIAFQAIY
jgi:hypothetical protein